MTCTGTFASSNESLYLFLDESGDLIFTPRHSAHFIFTGLWTYEPDCIASALRDYRRGLLDAGHDVERFHAKDNPRPIREQVFEILSEHRCAKAAAVIVRKNRTNPSIRDPEHFYPRFLDTVVKFAVKGEWRQPYKRVRIITDKPPTKKIGRSVQFSLRRSVEQYIRKGADHQIFQHASSAHPGLQAADYCCWALNRRARDGEDASWRKVAHLFDKAPLDVFARGDTEYY